jgi:thiol-disulfide isomerase/thioredoxin
MISQLRNLGFTLTLIGCVSFCGVNTCQAKSAVTVKRIAEADLDNLMNGQENRLLISFMAAWCAPCVDELPTLNNLYKKYNHQGLKIIGISIDLGGPAQMQPIVSKMKINFPVYWYGEKAVTKFSLNAIPMLLFISQGKIIERLPGRRSEKFLDRKIRDLLK